MFRRPENRKLPAPPGDLLHSPHSRGSRPTARLALAFALALACHERATSAPPANEATAESLEGSDLEAADALIAAYRAIAGGAPEAAARGFAPGIRWRVHAAGAREIVGREALTAYFGAGRSDDQIGLARALVIDDDLVILQGRFVSGGPGDYHVTGFMIFARAEDGEITEVKEVLAPAQAATASPRMPRALERVVEVGDPVRQTIAETLDESWTTGDWGQIEAMFSADFAYHNLGAGLETTGFAAYRDFFQARGAPFPDMSFEILGSWAAGEYVVLEKRIRGTHTAPLGALAPTGRTIEVVAFDLLRFEGEEIAEIWTYYDPAEIDAQLRAPAQADAPE